MKPTAEQKARLLAWCEDLESGKFTQTKECLHDEEGFCCLGVACETFKRLTGRGNWVDDCDEKYFVVGADSESTLLPLTVAEWFGIETNPYLPLDDRVLAAAEWNDQEGRSFKEIAALIRRKFLLPEK